MTTPEAPDIQETLRVGLAHDCSHGTIEVSSHALHLQRVFGCHFPVAVFTNLSLDHLDFHKDLEEYFRAKLLLFQRAYNPGLKYVVTNADDVYGRRLAKLSEAQSFCYGTSEGADIYLENHKATNEGLELRLDFFGRTVILQSQLIGTHNLYNIMAAAAASSLSGIPDEMIREGIRGLQSVPGRFEKVPVDAPFTIILDFAHTPDALENALNLAAKVSLKRVICVFGCGGDRDRGKRPLMGRISAERADVTIVTSDNPRSEDPERIIWEIEQGIPPESSKVESITDRQEAIRRALEIAEEGDLILLAGKGHESYQEVSGDKIHFDEREIIKEALCLN
jgi:UDP-N-acetylmuramoyl-L-alanyl-D-glutamate--2,6-diaminopimelate ligase